MGPVNVYLAEGDELTLIDTGPRDPATLFALRRALSSHGHSVQDIRRVLITHAHVDHFGLAAQVVAESGAQVLSHSRNRWWLTDYAREWDRRRDFYQDVVARSGAPREFLANVVQGMEHLAEYGAAVPAERFKGMEDGDVVTLGGDPWRVVFAPGHAGGLICLYDAASRTLISSDHLLRDITSNPVLEPSNRGETERPRALVDYIASLERVGRMEVLYSLPAHGEPIYDARALIAGRLAFHRSRLDHIEAQLECCAQTPFEICSILFPKVKSFDTILALSEVIGHLDVLEQEGRVQLETEDGIWRYCPIRK